MDLDQVKRAMIESAVGTKEAADILGVGRSTVNSWCAKVFEGQKSRLKPEEVTTDAVGRYLIAREAIFRLKRDRMRFKF